MLKWTKKIDLNLQTKVKKKYINFKKIKGKK